MTSGVANYGCGVVGPRGRGCYCCRNVKRSNAPTSDLETNGDAGTRSYRGVPGVTRVRGTGVEHHILYSVICIGIRLPTFMHAMPCPSAPTLKGLLCCHAARSFGAHLYSKGTQSLSKGASRDLCMSPQRHRSICATQEPLKNAC